MYLQKSKAYSKELKKTACHTLDRDILFDFITSNEFITYNELIEQHKESLIQDSLKVLQRKPTSTIDDLIQSFDKLSQNVRTAKTVTILDESTQDSTSSITNDLQSEQAWLNLTQNSLDNSESESFLDDNQKKIKQEKQKKLHLIDKFIETNPKITPSKKSFSTTINIEDSLQDNNSLMTETLAKIYLEQKKYQKAIQAYEILILKYPEKSSFFADQISDIKALQQHNS
ncbi:tetratricopeptide repeat protein [Myroides sp. LJL119]